MEAFASDSDGLIFATYPTCIAGLIDGAQQVGEIDFTGTRLMPSGIIRQLDVTYLAQFIQNGGREVAFHHLHMIDVILQAEVGMINFPYNVKRLRSAGKI